MSVAVLALLVGATVLFASATQRITGLGYALVASPPLVLLLGAATGVALIQIMGVSVAVVVLLSTFKHVSWRKAAGLALPALIGIIPGWWLARTVPGPVLLTLIGGMVLLALLTMVANYLGSSVGGILLGHAWDIGGWPLSVAGALALLAVAGVAGSTGRPAAAGSRAGPTTRCDPSSSIPRPPARHGSPIRG
ncbi:sulfite exporter TauE/SafE family protein [Tessaracoccus massiliensis]|uniref:sulfite exporter TauE/SafE family protein n=1 Tax=Tessaracoccus massiliensis TaxID=1522311 RepID=UPI001118377C|nr:sulfite exporter TauE/SafE family protein [Tessaracoccus massiliensis]